MVEEMFERTVHNRGTGTIVKPCEETDTGLTFPFSQCGHGMRVRGSAWLWQTSRGFMKKKASSNAWPLSV